MNKEYAEKVEVLLRLLPIVMDEKVFAVHGGSAINLFVRDLFDVKYMEYPLAETREDLLFCLLGSDRPLHESFAPNLIDQHDALANQFDGMTDVPLGVFPLPKVGNLPAVLIHAHGYEMIMDTASSATRLERL